jgi:16S rRNA (adenine1518-N6/adenine1519-N6)-dimethyltransferase
MTYFHTNKDLGQNFLTETSIAEKIVGAASVRPSDLVIEIGPGKGALTFPLAAKASFVLAIEIDPRLCNALGPRIGDAPNVEVRNADFLALNLQEEAADLRKRFPQAGDLKVISNLPYSITTPVAKKIIENRAVIDRSVLTIQKEVARRFTAGPGSKQYGSITVFLTYYAEMEFLFAIPKEAFDPRPQVDGGVISISPRPRPAVDVSDEKFFFRVTRAAFAQRRKMLKNSLLSLGLSAEAIDGALRLSGLESTQRPERVSLQEFARLSEVLLAASKEKIA